MKKCSKCKIEKKIIEFYKAKNRKDGLQGTCKSCFKVYYLRDYDANKEKKKLYNENYRASNKDRIKSYYLKNKEERKLYVQKNIEKVREAKKKWLLKNKDYHNNYFKSRKKTDALFRLKINITSRVYSSIKNNGYSKKSKTYEILGCDFETFKAHLENQFTEGMNWSNQGEWHLDHIYPVSLARDEQHLIELNHYTNFQPLWAEDNIRKGNKLVSRQQ
jgi:hypothetical protein